MTTSTSDRKNTDGMTTPAQRQSNAQPSNLVLSERVNSYTQVLTLNRPEKRNALSVALMQQLCSAYETAQQDPAIRVVILRGAGDVFCAGLDLQEANQAGKTDSSRTRSRARCSRCTTRRWSRSPPSTARPWRAARA